MSDFEGINYPQAPDKATGRARVWLDGKDYYFGKHNTPESYQLFGIWKADLIKTGRPAPVRDVRAHLKKHLPDERVERGLLANRVIIGSAATMAVFTVGIVYSLKKNSLSDHPLVDGQEMSEQELMFVRGIRTHESRKVAYDKETVANNDTLRGYLKLKDSRPPDVADKRAAHRYYLDKMQKGKKP